MRPLALALVLAACALWAQPPVAPTPTEPEPHEQTIGGYTISQSFEVGVRARSVAGSTERYESDINYRPGVRLLSSTLTLHSLEGHGKLFDELTLTTQGLGNDPYESAILRLRLNRWYRYDLNFRLNDFVDPGLRPADPSYTAGQHYLNTRRQWQDHDFTLLPTSPIQILAGVSRNSQTGPALSSIQLLNSAGDEYPIFTNVNRTQTEYRLGTQVVTRRLRMLLMHGWQFYNESTNANNPVVELGNNPADNNVLNSFTSTMPYKGSSPFWRGNLGYELNKLVAISARYDYAAGRRNFSLDELATGLDRFGNNFNRQTLVGGTGSRPVSSGAFTISLFPADKITIANQTAFHQIQMNGNSSIAEIDSGTATLNLLEFQYLGIRTLLNTTDVNVQPRRWLGFFGGFGYSDRRIRSTAVESFVGGADLVSAEQSNRLKTGNFGIRLRPIARLTLVADSEIGRADKPFLPVSDRNYHAAGARAQYRAGKLTLSAASRLNYNTNSDSLTSFSSKNRNNSVNGTWAPSERFSLDAGYSKMHVDTLGSLNYFVTGNLTSGYSRYISNIHSTHVMARWVTHKRVDLFAGFTRVQDTGDGRSPIASGVISATPPDPTVLANSFFYAAQTFPLSFTSPQARVTVRLRPKLAWNLGYQYYNYGEKTLATYNYRAHTGYSSLLWSF